MDTATNLVAAKRALLSVSDKTGLVDFAKSLVEEFHIELISTGGTAKALRDAGLTVRDVSDLTGFPEMMDGRLKTLHPKVHGGLLAIRDEPEHAKAMIEHDIGAIDVLVVNLYPFTKTIANLDTSFEEAIEQIDIGGPAMLRAAAKNHRYVSVVCEVAQYDKILGDLRKHGGSTCETHRVKLAQAAFAHTANYDAAISQYLLKHNRPRVEDVSPDPLTALPTMLGDLVQRQSLRYGENPHQRAALFVPRKASTSASVASARQLFGKELSYINLLDADAALAATREFTEPAACIVKHATPCGIAIGNDVTQAFARAYAADSLAAFGGIVAVNRKIDAAAASAMSEGQKFLEVIVAPAFETEAVEVLSARWKNVRLLEVGEITPSTGGTELTLHQIQGGLLAQERDIIGSDPSAYECATQRKPSAAELVQLRIAELACKHVKSNAIVLAGDNRTLGIGGGQVDRVTAARLAIEKAGPRSVGSVAASDAFFPFPDGLELLAKAGVTAVVQPGGSVRDAAVIAAADAAGMAMVFSGKRHFRH